jgi:hypothetical protein
VFKWYRSPPHGVLTLIINNGRAEDDVRDHIRIPSMQCNDLEVSNITQTDEGHYQCVCESGNYVYKLKISGK